MATYRMLPPGDGRHPTIVVSGRTYTAALGSYVDVVGSDDANALEANGWSRGSRNATGTTAQRPAPSTIWWNYSYLDTTLGKVIVWDGFNWRDPATAAVV